MRGQRGGGTFGHAADWAEQAGNANMAATSLSMKAHLAWSTGDARRCCQMARAARCYAQRVTPGVRGMAASVALRFAADSVAVNPYARGELLHAARTLERKGARQGKTI